MARSTRSSSSFDRLDRFVSGGDESISSGRVSARTSGAAGTRGRGDADGAAVSSSGGVAEASSRSSDGPTSAQPISRSGPTASNSARPISPAMSGSATFKASVTKLETNSRRRAGRITSAEAPRSDNCRIAISSASTDRSTAGATSGATQPGTPSRRPKVLLTELNTVFVQVIKVLGWRADGHA